MSKVTGNKTVEIVFRAYLHQTWIDIREKNKMITSAFYTCRPVHFTSENVSCL